MVSAITRPQASVDSAHRRLHCDTHTSRPNLQPSALHIKLFGVPQLVTEEQPLTLPRRQARALLYRVAAAHQPVPRDQLCWLLWPDSPDVVARRNLSVSTLR